MEQIACIDCRHFVDTRDGQREHLGYVKYEPWCENPKWQEFDYIMGKISPEARKTRENGKRCGTSATGFEAKPKPKKWKWW